MSIDREVNKEVVHKEIFLYDSLEGWDGVGGRREVQEGGDVYMCLFQLWFS